MKIKNNIFTKIERHLANDREVFLCKVALLEAIKTSNAVDVWLNGYAVRCDRHNKERLTCDIFYNNNIVVRLKIGELGDNIICRTDIYCHFDKVLAYTIYNFENSLCLAWLELRNEEIDYASN